MIKSWIIVLFVGIVQISFAQDDSISNFDIVGIWKGNDGSQDGSFTFDKEGHAIIKTKEVVFGGKNFSRGDKVFSLTYGVNLQEEPYQLDFTFTELKSQRTMVWPCIFKIIDPNKIVLARGSSGKRPEDFKDYESITLVKEE